MSIVTKGDLTKGAYQLIRISGLTRSEVPEETEIALSVADDYAAEILPFMDIGWQYPSDYGASDPADNSGLSKEMAGAFKKLLAFQLIEFYGKQPSQVLVKLASDGMKSLEQTLVNVDDALPPATLPFGSGNEQDYRDRKFYSEPPNNKGATNVFRGDVLNYTEDLSTWCVDATLVTAVWETGGAGISIANETLGDTTASAELTFNQAGGYNLCITVTKTGSTDVFTVNKNFIVSECAGMRFS